MLTSAEQLDELMRVTRYPRIRARLAPGLAGRLINEHRAVALVMTNLPAVAVCPIRSTTICWRRHTLARRITS